MLNSSVVEISRHTCHYMHLYVASLADLMQRNITTNQTEIEENNGKAVNTYCIQKTAFTSDTLELVRQLYFGAVMAKRGWNTAATDRYLLYRTGIQSYTAWVQTALLTRISGWL